MILRNESILQADNFAEIVLSCKQEFERDLKRFNKLDNYYKGNHDILKREPKGEFAPNNKIVNNFAKYITDTSCGYLLGNPVSYADDAKKDINALLDVLRKTDAQTHDAELEKDLSVFGVGYELLYMSSDDNTTPKLALLDPRTAFVVYDTTVELKPLLGTVIAKRITDTGADNGYLLTVYTKDTVYEYVIDSMDTNGIVLLSEAPHYFGGVPLVQYYNNEEEQGDFEGVISLIDAYNLLQSDRTNDKERFVDAILLIIDAQLGEEDAKQLSINRILQLPNDSDARYITKSLNESETQILVNSIRDDIHKFSQTPDFTDENFSGNTSGVAMAYKLLSLENLAKVKERFFIAGLKQRIKLILNVLSIKNTNTINMDTLKVVLKRTLPVNEKELAEIVVMLKDTVSQETLLTRLPFVEDVDFEIKKVKEERTETDQRMNSNFGISDNVDKERF